MPDEIRQCYSYFHYSSGTACVCIKHVVPNDYALHSWYYNIFILVNTMQGFPVVFEPLKSVRYRQLLPTNKQNGTTRSIPYIMHMGSPFLRGRFIFLVLINDRPLTSTSRGYILANDVELICTTNEVNTILEDHENCLAFDLGSDFMLPKLKTSI